MTAIGKIGHGSADLPASQGSKLQKGGRDADSFGSLFAGLAPTEATAGQRPVSRGADHSNEKAPEHERRAGHAKKTTADATAVETLGLVAAGIVSPPATPVAPASGEPGSAPARWIAFAEMQPGADSFSGAVGPSADAGLHGAAPVTVSTRLADRMHAMAAGAAAPSDRAPIAAGNGSTEGGRAPAPADAAAVKPPMLPVAGLAVAPDATIGASEPLGDLPLAGAGGATVNGYRTHFAPYDRDALTTRTGENHGPAAAAGPRWPWRRPPGRATASAAPDGAATDPDSDATGALATDGSVGGTQSGATPRPLPPTALATLTDAIAGAANAAAIASPDKAAAAVASPARQVTLSVDLQDLGVVNMSMTLSGRSLTLRMTAHLAETARRLQGDHDGLSLLLGKAGFDAQVIRVDSAAPSDPSAAGAGFAQGGTGSGGDASGYRQSHTEQGAWPQPAERKVGKNETGIPGGPRAGALYV